MGDVAAYYSKHPDVMQQWPGTHIAHVTWDNIADERKRNKRESIDYFLTDERLTKDRIIPVSSNQADANTENLFDIHYTISGAYSDQASLVRAIVCADIDDFADVLNMDLRSSSGFLDSRLSFVDEFVSRAKITPVKHAQLAKYGKEDFNDECLFHLNLDFAVWCYSSVTPDLKWAPLEACSYCYASYKHKSFPNVFNVKADVLEKQILKMRAQRAEAGKPTRYMRLGKRTDAGAPIFREQLLNTLEACERTGISVIMPTKYPNFDQEIAEAFKRTESVFLLSVDNDELSPGAVRHGFPNARRFEEGLRYLEAGVNAVPYVLVDITQERGGHMFEESFTTAVENFPAVQLLPIRLVKNDLITRILGHKEKILGPKSIGVLGEEMGGYVKMRDNSLLHNFVHTTIAELVGDNDGAVRVCGHTETEVDCGKCFAPGEKGVSVPRVHKVIVYNEKLIAKRTKKPSKGQGVFGFAQKK